MNAYIVTFEYYGYDGDETLYKEIEGVFSTKDKANAYIKTLRDSGRDYGTFDVNEYEVDEHIK